MNEMISVNISQASLNNCVYLTNIAEASSDGLNLISILIAREKIWNCIT